jgi:hypothetical protein
VSRPIVDLFHNVIHEDERITAHFVCFFGRRIFRGLCLFSRLLYPMADVEAYEAAQKAKAGK